MNKSNKKIHISDSAKAKDKVLVVRYMGPKIIREMIKNEQYIEAFVHTQLDIEKILWDNIVGFFETKKASVVRQKINKSKSITRTHELIKWAHFLGAINDDEFGDLIDFNKKRNGIIHGHGEWWNLKEYREALQKGVRFLEKNQF